MRRLVRLIVLIAKVIVMPGSALIREAVGALILAIHAILLEVIACAKLLTVAPIVSCRSFPTICCQLLNSVALRVQCVEHTIARLLGACANLIAGAAAISVLDSTRARVSILLSPTVVDKVVVGEPQRGRLEVALLALRVHPRAILLVGPVDGGRAIVDVLSLVLMAILTLVVVRVGLPSLLVRRVDDLEVGVRLLVQIVDSLLIGRQLQLILGNALLSGDYKR